MAKKKSTQAKPIDKAAASDIAAQARLHDRVYDMLCGAGGDTTDVARFFSNPPDERAPIVAELGSETFGTWIGALRQHLTFVSDAQRDMIVRPAFLSEYDDIDRAVTWLFGLGVRA